MWTPPITTMPLSNATNSGLAAYLASSKSGCKFSSLVIRKVGVTRGRGSAKKVYGDDVVLVTLVTGFSYTKLLGRDLISVREVSPTQLLAAVKKSCKYGFLNDFKTDDCKTALDEVEISIRKSLANENRSTTDHVREPTVVIQDGGRNTAKNTWVNNGRVDPFKTGNVYLMALKVSEMILEQALNGPIPRPESKATVVAKKVLEKVYLRRSRIVSYRLCAGQEYYLKIGGEAIIEARGNGIHEITDKMTVRAAWELGRAA